MKILVVEDDPLVSKTILRSWPIPSDQLQVVSTFAQWARILASFQIDDFDAVILDMNLPDGNAIQALTELRLRSNLPAIVISGIGSPESRASTLDIGADDYVMKPFSTRELQARVSRAVNRLSVHRGTQSIVDFGIFQYDFHSKTLKFQDEQRTLTNTEARLMSQFVSSGGKACSRQHLSETVCLRPFRPEDKTIDIYVGRLRAIFAKTVHNDVIETVRGVGYRFLPTRLSS